MEWFLRTELAGGASSSVALGDLGVGSAAVVDRVDINFSLGAPEGTNRDEILAIVGSNSSGFNLGIFGITAAGCAFRFDNGSGAPFVIPVAGTVAQLSGMRCDGALGSQFLVQLQASTMDGTNWATTDSRIAPQGAQSLVFDVVIHGSLTVGDSQLAEYGQATCGGEDLLADF